MGWFLVNDDELKSPDWLKIGSRSREDFSGYVAGLQVPPEVKARMRAQYEEARVGVARTNYLKSFEEAKQRGNEIPNPFSTVASAAANYVNTGLFGAPAKAFAMGGAIGIAKKYDIPYWEAEKLAREVTEGMLSDSPTGRVVGEVAAYVSPRGAVTAGTTLVTKAAQSVARPLAERAANAASRSRLASSMWQLGAALTAGSTGAAIATAGPAAVAGIGEQSPGEYAQSTLLAPMKAAASPLTVGLSAASAVPAALGRIPVNQAVRDRMAWAARKMPGLSPTVAETRPGTFGSSMIDAAANTPYGRNALRQTLDKNLYGPFNAALDEMRAAMGISRNPTTAVSAAANVARNLPNTLSKRLEAHESVLSSALGGQVQAPTLNGLRGVVSNLRAEGIRRLGTEGGRHPKVVEAMGLIRKFTGKEATVDATGNVLWKGRPVTYQHLHNVMGRLDDFIDWSHNARQPGVNMGAEFSSASMREAKTLRAALRETFRQVGGIESQIDAIRQIRQTNNSIQFVQKNLRSGTDKSVLDSILQAPDFSRRWGELSRNLKPEEVDVLRGGYVAELIEHVSLPRDTDLLKFLDPARITPDQIARLRRTLFSATRIDESLRGGGKFSADRVRTILGQEAVEDVVRMGEVSQWFAAGSARAEGSQTASREAAKQVLDSASGVFGRGMDLLTTLPPRAAVYFGFTNSILNGRMAKFLQNLSSGEPAIPMRPQQALGAIQSQGGILRSAEKGLYGAGEAAGGAMQGLGTWAETTMGEGNR